MVADFFCELMSPSIDLCCEQILIYLVMLEHNFGLLNVYDVAFDKNIKSW